MSEVTKTKCGICGTVNDINSHKCRKCGYDLDMYGTPVLSAKQIDEYNKKLEEEQIRLAEKLRERAEAEAREREQKEAEEAAKREREKREREKREAEEAEAREREKREAEKAEKAAKNKRRKKNPKEKTKTDKKGGKRHYKGIIIGAAALAALCMATAAVIVPNIPSGECGDDMTWRIVGKTLTISGTGDMWDRSYIDVSIWNSYRENIDNVVVKSGVTRIGAGAFKNFDSLTSVTLPDSLTSIGGWSFMHCGDLTEITIPSGVMSIDGGAFDYCESLTAVNYSGTESDWNNIEISERGNDYLLAAEITFLSE